MCSSARGRGLRRGVLAVVLTGMGSDGMIGCRIIREHGGSVLAQDQATSTVWGMPGAVANAGLAHKVLPLGAIAPKSSGSPAGRAQRSPRASGIGGVAMENSSSSVDYGYLRQLVFGLSQNVLDPSRDYLFDTRLTKLLRNQGMTALRLVQHLKLRKNPAPRALHRRGHDHQRNQLLPRQPSLRTVAHRTAAQAHRIPPHTRSLRFWSAACSTGQEAYSLAMLMLEHFPMLAGWNIRIEGTDICAEVVERAQAGCYHRIEINRGLPARFVVRYFDHVGEDWVVKPEVRKMCNFRQANLCGAAAALQPRRRPLRRDLPAQRHALLLAGDAQDPAGRHSPRARARRHPLSRLQRAARRSLHLDPGPRRRHLPLPALAKQGTGSRDQGFGAV
jgi:chemotaxis protein methyltransferase CheR